MAPLIEIVNSKKELQEEYGRGYEAAYAAILNELLQSLLSYGIKVNAGTRLRTVDIITAIQDTVANHQAARRHDATEIGLLNAQLAALRRDLAESSFAALREEIKRLRTDLADTRQKLLTQAQTMVTTQKKHDTEIAQLTQVNHDLSAERDRQAELLVKLTAQQQQVQQQQKR